jgi:hypothetical protein
MKDGGPAFPESQSEMSYAWIGEGMSLRDYFAAKAMIALHCSDERNGDWSDYLPDITAKHAYEMADAMLAEREK